jgi:CheY-like chemotaxis protein
VIEYGLAPGAQHNLVVIAEGTSRATIVADWLHGKGTGRRLGPDTVEDADGHAYRIVRAADAQSLQPAVETADIPVEEAPIAELPAEHEPAPVPAGSPVARALIADDSIVARVFLGRLLRQRGIRVDEADDAAGARALWAENDYDWVFLDADMPGGGAFSIADAARPEVVVLVKDELERRHARTLGFEVVLLKPFAEDEVARAIEARAARVDPGG